MRLTINQKLILLFALFMSLLVVLGSGAFYYGMRQVLIQNTRAELIATALEKEAMLAGWFDERVRDMEQMASSQDVRRAMTSLFSTDAAQVQSGRDLLLSEFDERVADQGGFASILLLDYESGRVIAASDAALAHVDWPHQAAFFNGRSGTFLQTPYRFGSNVDPLVAVSVPVRISADEPPVGVLVALFQVGLLNETLARRGSLRQTDESFLVNSAGQYVTAPRLNGKIITLLETTDTSPAVHACLTGQTGFDFSPDYRGVPTLKAYRWVPTYGLCLVTKVDETEAMRPVNELVPFIVLWASLIFLLGLFAAGLLARTITRPVLDLTHGAGQLAAGRRDVRLSVNTGDELERLADAFNSMSAALAAQEGQLREYAAQLEAMVSTRTAELHASEALGRAVMENSPVGISVRNNAGDLIFWNQAWLSIYGTDEDELRALRQQVNASPRARQVLRSELSTDVQYIQHEGGLFIPELLIEVPRLKTTRWISEYAYAIPNPQGKIDRVVMLTEDITERKQRQQEMENLLIFSAAVRNAETRRALEDTVMAKVCQLIGVENAGIILRDPDDFNIIRGRGCNAWSDWAEKVYQPAHMGIAGEVLRTGQMYVTDNVYNDPRLVGNNLGDVTTLSLAPLVVHNEVTGAMVIGAKAPFSESQLRLFRAMSDLTANAFYRLSLSELTERRLQWLTAIRVIDQSIMGSIDLRITFNVLLDRTVSQLSLDAAAILLLRQNSRLEYTAWRGFREVKPAHMFVRLGDLQAGLAALDQHTIIVKDYRQAENWKSDIMEREGLRGYCAVPLIAKGQVKGVLEVFSKAPLNLDPEWIEFLESLAGLAAISIENITLIETIQRTNTELSVAYDSTLMGWSQTVEMREAHKQGHVRRMADQTLDLARMLGVDERDLAHIHRGVLLHDIGTLAIPEEILHKDGSLTPEERALLETHTEHAYRTIQSVEYLRPALDIPYAHHEKWDGSGYPRGLKGEQIPLAARIFAVVDVWDALTHDRPHRKAFTEAQALDYIREQSGRHFDPRVVEAFLRLLGK